MSDTSHLAFSSRLRYITEMPISSSSRANFLRVATLLLISTSSCFPSDAVTGKLPVSVGIEVVRKVEGSIDNAVGGHDPIGNVVVTYSDGTVNKLTMKGNCSNPKISPEGTVGWIVYTLNGYGTSLKTWQAEPENGKVCIYKSGNILTTVSSTYDFIEEWGFTKDGHRFVVKSRSGHGPASIQLFDLKDGPAKATVPAYASDLPDWAISYRDPN